MWVEKYRPKTIDEIIGIKDEIANISKWLKVFREPHTAYKGFKNGILISGVPGIGKTTVAHVLLKHFDFDALEFNASELRTSKEICGKLETILSGKSIKTMFAPNSLTGIIMDEIDGIEAKKEYSANDIVDYLNYSENLYNKLVKEEERREKEESKPTKKKGVVLPIIPFRRESVDLKKKQCHDGIWVNKNPIICICNVVNKNISNLLKHVHHFEFTPPSNYQILQLLKRVNTAENLGLSDVDLNIILPQCQNDNRRALYLLEQIAISKQANAEHDVYDLVQNLGSKDIDIGLFDAIKEIFNSRKVDINKLLQCFEVDQNFVPFLIHENFVNYIDKNTHNSYSEKLDISLEYYDSLLTSQIFKNDIFGHWELSDYIGFFSCVIPNRIIKGSKLKQLQQMTHFEKSALISKYNYRYYNLKSINSISKKLGIDIVNFQLVSSVIVESIFGNESNNLLEETIEYFTNKGLSFKQFEKAMKLSFHFEEYHKRYTKKLQKQLENIYLKHCKDKHIEDSDELE